MGCKRVFFDWNLFYCVLIATGAISLPSLASTWSTRVTTPLGTGMHPLDIDCRQDTNGVVAATFRFGGRTLEGYRLGTKAYISSPDRSWKNIPEMHNGESPSEFMRRMIWSITPPDEHVAKLSRLTTNAQTNAEVTTADLPPESVGFLLNEQMKAGKQKNEQIKGAGGNVKFWSKGGKVTKYQLVIHAKARREDGTEEDLSRIETTEIDTSTPVVIDLPAKAREVLFRPSVKK
jgi:hypothetical protein